MPRLPRMPDLDWRDAEAPRAAAFDDVYFSRDGGLAESEAVFLAGCDLPATWRNQDRFALCELGFGSGLNLLAVWRAWKKTRSSHAQLHISTIEAFPLAREDAARALGCFPEVADLARKLLARWPVRAFGPQRLWFPEDGLCLTVHIGDAATVLPDLEGAFDAWFLDGFAPARNPAMWSPDVLRNVARLSAPGARLATFTVAGQVRRELESAGFRVEKKPGFGAKRERLEAVFVSTAARSAPPSPPGRVAIVGAGIAGAACAQAFARRGVETVVLDAAPALGAGASGNPAGLVMPRLDRGGALSGFYLSAFLHAVATYEALGAFTPTGVAHYADARNGDALADLAADPPLPPDWFASWPGGVLHKRAGVVSPRRAVAAMLADAQVLFETSVQRIDASDAGWVLRAPGGRALLKADAVVLACGAALRAFEPAAFLPIALSRGQVEWGTGTAAAHALTRGAYVAPFDDGVLFGATFDPLAEYGPVEADTSSRERNMEALRALAPEIASTVNAASLRSRASIRATTPDRAPIAGMLPNAETWRASADARRFHDGVFLLGGLGARGMTHAPLLGEMIAGAACGEPTFLSQRARAALAPERFLQRALRRS